MKSRSGQLLRDVVRVGAMTADEVCTALDIAPDDYAQLSEGTRVMSLPLQLCFATLLIERVPRFARRGYALRGQIAAATAFKNRATTVHSSSPLRWSRLRA